MTLVGLKIQRSRAALDRVDELGGNIQIALFLLLLTTSGPVIVELRLRSGYGGGGGEGKRR